MSIEVTMVSVVVVLSWCLCLCFLLCFGSVIGGNVPERDDHARCFNVIVGDYWEIGVSGFLFVAA